MGLFGVGVMSLVFFINITCHLYSVDCEECKLEYVDNCLIHPLIPMTDTQVNMALRFESVDMPKI